MTNEDRSRRLDAERLGRVKDAHVRMALQLQAAFGLRREEPHRHLAAALGAPSLDRAERRQRRGPRQRPPDRGLVPANGIGGIRAGAGAAPQVLLAGGKEKGVEPAAEARGAVDEQARGPLGRGVVVSWCRMVDSSHGQGGRRRWPAVLGRRQARWGWVRGRDPPYRVAPPARAEAATSAGGAKAMSELRRSRSRLGGVEPGAGAREAADADPSRPGAGARRGIALAKLVTKLHPQPPEDVAALVAVRHRPRAPPRVARVETSTIARSPVAASTASIPAWFASPKAAPGREERGRRRT